MFLVQKFPVSWKTTDLQIAIKDLGYTTIKWIDDQSCLVIVRDKSKVEVAVEMTKKTIKKKSKFVITRFIGESVPVDVDAGDKLGSTKKWFSEYPSARKRARSESPGADAGQTKKNKKSCLLM